MANEKVILSKTTKINGKFVKAGETIEVSPAEKKDLLKRDMISDGEVASKENKEVAALKAKIKELEELQVSSDKGFKSLQEENKTLKDEIEALKKADTKESEKKADLLGKK